MIKHTHINTYKFKLRANKVEYNTNSSLHKTTHDAKVPFRMPEFSNRKIITYRLHIDNAQGDTGIGHEMIICHDLMVQLGLKANIGRRILEWSETAINMKFPDNFLGQTYLTK